MDADFSFCEGVGLLGGPWATWQRLERIGDVPADHRALEERRSQRDIEVREQDWISKVRNAGESSEWRRIRQLEKEIARQSREGGHGR